MAGKINQGYTDDQIKVPDEESQRWSEECGNKNKLKEPRPGRRVKED
jgi:hypothetical protein